MTQTKHNFYLQQMGIDVWEDRSTKPQSPNTQPAAAVTPLKSLDWDALKERVAACQACGLEKTRTQTVFGVGNRQAELMIIGEAPGRDEDLKGEPFVGKAGQLLDAMLKAIDLQREQVYIANILKCRPPNNRDPKPDEVALCTPFLQQQIALIKPKLILAVGRIAAQYLLASSEPLGKMRGRIYNYGEYKTPLLITYHPAYLLRAPLEKRKAWQDLCQVRDYLGTCPK